MNFPNDLKYTEHDEWIRIDGDIVTVGITAYAQDALGELVHIELPKVGDTFSPGDVLCEVESVKAVAEVFSPVDGEVTLVNEELDGNEESVNSDPYGAGWLVKLRASDLSSLDRAMTAAEYEKKVQEA